MPTYTFKCDTCTHTVEKRLMISQAQVLRVPCECGGSLSKGFSPSNWRGQFMKKGYGWSDKDVKEKSYREGRSKWLDKRQKDVHPVAELAPNVDGERVDSWSDAKKLAGEKGYNTREYESKVDKLISAPR